MTYRTIEALKWVSDDEIELGVTDVDAIGMSGKDTRTGGPPGSGYSCTIADNQVTPTRTYHTVTTDAEDPETIPVEWNFQTLNEGASNHDLTDTCNGPAGEDREAGASESPGAILSLANETLDEDGIFGWGAGAFPTPDAVQREALQGKDDIDKDDYLKEGYETAVFGDTTTGHGPQLDSVEPVELEENDEYVLPHGTSTETGTLTVHAHIVSRPSDVEVKPTTNGRGGAAALCSPPTSEPQEVTCANKIGDLLVKDGIAILGEAAVTVPTSATPPPPQLVLPPSGNGTMSTSWQILPPGGNGPRQDTPAQAKGKPTPEVLLTGSSTVSSEAASLLKLTPTQSGDEFFAGPHPATKVTVLMTLAPKGGGSPIRKKKTFLLPAVSASAGTPTSAIATAGTPQATVEGHPFVPLEVKVTDAHGDPVPDATVTFTAPGSGASGIFPSGTHSESVTTDDNGVASVAPTGDDSVGSFTVQATVNGVTAPADFELTDTSAGGACQFASVGTELVLESNCATSHTITIPEGVTLNGSGYAITAIDPEGGPFSGPVLANAGATANVANLVIIGDFVNDACPASPSGDREGIGVLNGSTAITGVTILNMTTGEASNCSDGDGIVVEDASGTGPFTASIEHDTLSGYQSIGIKVSGAHTTATIKSNGLHALHGSDAAGGVFSIWVVGGAGGTVAKNTINGGLAAGSRQDSTGVLADSTTGLAIDENRVQGTNFGVSIESLCPSASQNVVSGNEIEAANIGVYLVAQYVPSDTTCTPEVNENTVTENIIEGPGTFGVWLAPFANGGPYSPTLNANTISANTISDYIEQVNNEGSNTILGENGE